MNSWIQSVQRMLKQENFFLETPGDVEMSLQQVSEKITPLRRLRFTL
jgi:hypothetical protein